MTDDHRTPTADPNRPWYSIQAAAAGQPKRARVQIYDAIGGYFGVRTSDFVRELNALDVDQIDLHLNSPGGLAWDGIAIHNALRQHKAKVTATVDGLAASAASIVAMGADEVIMARGSQLMIHDAAGLAWGPASVQRKTADVLDKLSGNMAKVYAAKAGGEAKAWRDLMVAETWYDAAEAVTAGLADRTDEDSEADAKAVASFDLAAFNYAGRASAPAPNLAVAAMATATTPAQRAANRNRAAAELAEVYARLFGGEPDPGAFAGAEPAQVSTTTNSTPSAAQAAADAALYAKAFPSGPPDLSAALTASEKAEDERLFPTSRPDLNAGMTAAERAEYARLFPDAQPDQAGDLTATEGEIYARITGQTQDDTDKGMTARDREIWAKLQATD